MRKPSLEDFTEEDIVVQKNNLTVVQTYGWKKALDKPFLENVPLLRINTNQKCYLEFFASYSSSFNQLKPSNFPHYQSLHFHF